MPNKYIANKITRAVNKKCPPGIICIENVTMFFLIAILFIIGYLVYIGFIKKDKIIVNIQREQQPNPVSFIVQQPNIPYNNIPVNDVLMNPYVPPLSDDRYLIPEIARIPRGAVPINISTNPGAVDTNYRQMGILTPLRESDSSHKKRMLPLMGRPLFTNRNKWQYYTMSDQNNSIKLPIYYQRKNCTNEYGCDELNSGDRVFVEGYNEGFRVSIYENDTMKYLPFI